MFMHRIRIFRATLAALQIVGVFGVAASLGGCVQSNEIGEPEKALSAYPAFPENSSPAPPSEARLQARLTQPRTDELRSNLITVAFNKPMVAAAIAEQPVDEPLFEIEPAIKGKFAWVGSRMAVFHPNEPFAPAATYSVRVPAGLKSLDGTPLESATQFSFHTPFLKVWAQSSDPKLKPDSVITLHFNHPVAQAALEEAITLKKDGQIVQPRLVAASDADKPSPTRFELTLAGGFEFHAKYTLRVDGSLRPIGGHESLAAGITQQKISLTRPQARRFQQRYTAAGYQAEFESYGDFEVTTVSCGYGDQCYQSDSWAVNFSNPVDPDSVEKCLRFASQPSPRTSTYDSQVWVYPSGFKQGESQTIIVGTSCRDIFGNPLKQARRFTKEIAYNEPGLRMSSGLRIIESAPAQGMPSIPIFLENLTQPATARAFRVQGAQLPKIQANLWSDAPPPQPADPALLYTRTLGAHLQPGQPQVYPFDLSDALSAPPGAVYMDVSAPDIVTRYDDGTRRLLLVFSDLGITAKTDGQSAHIWVTRLSTGEAVQGAEVALWDSKGERRWSEKTDARGLVSAPNQYAIVTATLGDDMSMLELDGWQSRISPYSFEVPYYGEQPALRAKNFIFTERGVYKKGDTVHIKGFSRLDHNGALGAMPAERISLQVQDSRGKNIALESVALSPLGGFSLDVTLPDSAALGTYSIKATPLFDETTTRRTPALQTLQSGISGRFRVEAYRTPEFEVEVEPASTDVMVGSSASVQINGRYLFGAPMRGAETTWTAHRRQRTFESRDFPKFSFAPDATNHWYYDASPSRSLGDGSGALGEKGQLSLDLKIPADKDFQGAQSVEIEANITDTTRQQISGRATLKVHPGEYYVGVHQPEYLVRSDATITPQAIATDHQGRAVAGKDITLRVVRREWKTERKKNTSGYDSWVTTHSDTPVGSCTRTSQLTPVSCEFVLAGSGSYRVLAESRDAAGNLLSSATPFYAWGGASYTWDRFDDDRIELVADAETYKVGDVAKILIQSPFEHAHALVTVEQNTVLNQFTTELSGTSATVDIPITDAMKPNAYVSVSLVRGRVEAAPGAQKNSAGAARDPGRPAFKIGYTELKVDHSDKLLKVDITAERPSYRPGEQVHATVSLRDHLGAPTAGEVTFMAVDQGVLSLTGYQTPNPVDYFYASRPLGVSNHDTRVMLGTLEDLLAEEAGMKSSPGGSGSGVATNYRSDFAAAAAFRARVDVGPSGEARVAFKLPDTLTAYRLMAVAVASQNRFGSASTRITVNKPLMVRPSLPRFASSGDTFEARAVIQSMDDFVGKVDVQIALDGALSLSGQDRKTITLKAGENQEVGFPVRAGLPGDATVRFVATGLGQPAGEDAVEITLPVQYPAAQDTYIQTGTLALDASWAQPTMQRRIELPDSVRRDVGGLEITLSSSRIAELLPGLDYLLDYPYGCAEQVTSRVLGLIAMRDVAAGVDLPGLAAEDIERRALAGLQRVLAQQTHDGGISYWSGQSHAHDWASAYAALAVVRARADQAYQFDAKQYLDLLEYLRGILRAKLPGPDDGLRAALVTRAFAVWVLAEAGVAEPAYHEDLYAMRQLMPRSARLLLAMAMHRADATPTYRDTLLTEALADVQVDLGGDGGAATLGGADRVDPYGWRIWQSPTRDDAFALMALLRMRPDDPLIPKFAQGLLRKRRHGYWGSTQATAFAMMALGEYFGRAQQAQPDYKVLVGTGQKVVATERFEKLEVRPRRVFIPMKDLAQFEGKLLSIMQKGRGGPLYYSAKLTTVPKEAPSQAFDGGFHLKREYIAVDGPDAGKAVDTVRPGQVLKVRLVLTVPETRHYVAVEDPLPAGFEAINTAFDTTSRALVEAQLADAPGSYYHRWWSYGAMSFDYSAQHDDRIMLFKTDLRPGIYRHAYLARATTPGQFTAPAARVQTMYDPTIFGRSDARTVDID